MEIGSNRCCWCWAGRARKTLGVRPIRFLIVSNPVVWPIFLIPFFLLRPLFISFFPVVKKSKKNEWNWATRNWEIWIFNQMAIQLDWQSVAFVYRRKELTRTGEQWGTSSLERLTTVTLSSPAAPNSLLVLFHFLTSNNKFKRAGKKKIFFSSSTLCGFTFQIRFAWRIIRDRRSLY